MYYSGVFLRIAFPLAFRIRRIICTIETCLRFWPVRVGLFLRGQSAVQDLRTRIELYFVRQVGIPSEASVR